MNGQSLSEFCPTVFANLLHFFVEYIYGFNTLYYFIHNFLIIPSFILIIVILIIVTGIRHIAPNDKIAMIIRGMCILLPIFLVMNIFDLIKKLLKIGRIRIIEFNYPNKLIFGRIVLTIHCCKVSSAPTCFKI